MKYLCLFAIALAVVCAATFEKPKLHVDKDGKFRIAQLTDLHFGEGDEERTYQSMKTVINVGNPDFIAYTGDMVAGYMWDHSKNWYEKQWKKYTKLSDETHIPYGIALGNHDAQADLTRKEIITLDMQHEYSYSQLGPEGTVGASNFVVPVYAYGNDTQIAFNMWFFDTMDQGCMGVSGYGCIEPPTIQWYVDLSKKMEEEQGHVVPGVAFFHIPTYEYMYGWNHYNGYDRKYEDVCCSSMNSGLIANILMRKDIKATYAGHDHSNDYIIDFNGISLVYGRKTGDGCYGPATGVKIGGRLIVISTDSSFSIENSIINIDGEVEKDVKMEGKTAIQDVCCASHPPRTN